RKEARELSHHELAALPSRRTAPARLSAGALTKVLPRIPKSPPGQDNCRLRCFALAVEIPVLRKRRCPALDRRAGPRFVRRSWNIGAFDIAVVQNPERGAIEVLVLPVVERPQEGREPDGTEQQCPRYEIDKHGHAGAIAACSARAGGLGARGSARNALIVTATEDADIARAATSGVASPAIASGTATVLKMTANQRFWLIRRRARTAMSIARATGESASPRNTVSACACARSTALIGDSETCAAVSDGASFKPSPTKATRCPLAARASSRATLSAGLQSASAIVI